MLDTCLVRYHIENKDTQPHRVGLRFMLDTLIGLKPDGTPNDGVPFTVPGRNRLIDDFDDFTGKIPDFIQVLEEPNLQNPGVIAFLNPKIGGSIEPPGRVSLTRWDSNGLRQGWDIPLTPIRKVGAKAGEPEYDSAIVMYWNEQPLAPGAKREIGFTYGLGSVSATNSRLGVTVSRDLRPKNEFTVLAQVKQPEQDKEVTLKLPAGFELAEGEKATQTVPALGPGASNSPVTWRVIASPQVGNYDIEVTTNGGISQKKRISIRTESIF